MHIKTIGRVLCLLFVSLTPASLFAHVQGAPDFTGQRPEGNPWKDFGWPQAHDIGDLCIEKFKTITLNLNFGPHSVCSSTNADAAWRVINSLKLREHSLEARFTAEVDFFIQQSCWRFIADKTSLPAFLRPKANSK